MGNRAVITSVKRDLGVYLHWNGGPDSVEAFLDYCKLRGFRSPETDSYGYARLCQVLGNFFGADGLSVGISPYIDERVSDPGDNGIYVIKDWQVVEHLGGSYPESEGYDHDEMLRMIDETQPKQQQLGSFLNAEAVQSRDLSIGDKVYVQDLDGTYSARTVVGFGELGKVVNGSDVGGLPYVDRYSFDQHGGYACNINNYIRQSTVRLAQRAAVEDGCDLESEERTARDASESIEQEDDKTQEIAETR